MELGCLIIDRSAKGMKLRLDRELSLPNAFVVVETASGLAHEVTKAWTKLREVGVSAGAQTSLRGLVPARLTTARQAWLKAGGR